MIKAFILITIAAMIGISLASTPNMKECNMKYSNQILTRLSTTQKWHGVSDKLAGTQPVYGELGSADFDSSDGYGIPFEISDYD